jgi:hypothetical protein
MSGAAEAGGIFGVRNEDAGQLLETLDRVRSETRRARHAYWFPLLLSGLIILGNLPLGYWRIGDYGDPHFNGFLGFCLCNEGNHPFGSTLYWLIAVPLGFAAVAAFYVVRARRTGLKGSKIWPYVVTGLVMFGLVILTATRVPAPLRFMYRIDNWTHRATVQGFAPVLVIAFAFFALAALEHSKALWVITVAFLGVAVLANTYNIENAFYRINHWIVPGWAANLSVAGGFLVFAGIVSLIAQSVGSARHGASS